METKIREILTSLDELIGELTDASIVQGGLGDRAAADSLSGAARLLRESRAKAETARERIAGPELAGE